METTQKQNRIYRTILRVLQGAIVGVAGILPGMSGGVLCVIFGVYAPMMELLAHPFRTWKQHIKWIIPFVIGVGLGFFGASVLLDGLFKANAEIVTCIFIGLILGELPELFEEGGKEGRTRSVWVTFGIACAVLIALFLFLHYVSADLVPNTGWYLLCGALWGVSIIVPGMSSSSVLMNIGLYIPMTEGIANLDFRVLIPLGVGIAVVIIGFAKLVNLLFEKKYAYAYSIVIAAVIASSLTTFPPITQYSSVGKTFLDLACLCGGVLAALGFSYLSELIAKRVEKKKEA